MQALRLLTAETQSSDTSVDAYAFTDSTGGGSADGNVKEGGDDKFEEEEEEDARDVDEGGPAIGKTLARALIAPLALSHT